MYPLEDIPLYTISISN